MVTLGKQIKRARVQLGITRGRRVSQADLAGMIGASRSAVNAWENGRSIPDDYDMAALERALGTELVISSPSVGERVQLILDGLTEDERELLIARIRGEPDPPAREQGEAPSRDQAGLAG